MKPWSYYAKAQAGAAWLAVGAALGLMLALLLAGVYQAPGAPARPEDATLILGVFLPLALGLLLAGIPGLERSAGMSEICLTYRQPAWARLAAQAALAVIGWAVLALLTSVSIHFAYAPLHPAEALRLILPPSLGLGGAALAGGALSRTQTGGTLAVAAWWSIDLLQPGLNRIGYLFSRYQPVPGIDPGVMDLRLLIAAVLGAAAALLLAERRSRWLP